MRRTHNLTTPCDRTFRNHHDPHLLLPDLPPTATSDARPRTDEITADAPRFPPTSYARSSFVLPAQTNLREPVASAVNPHRLTAPYDPTSPQPSDLR